MCDIKGVENGGGMKLKQRTIYYQDELHDEFAGDHIKAKHIDRITGISGCVRWNVCCTDSGMA